MSSITVRPATTADAAAACEVLRRSIRELCVADHRDDERILAAWLANKTPENVRRWIATPSLFCVVAVEIGEVRGVGMVQRDGEIQLCYLVPEAQHRGIGKLLLRTLEAEAVRWGLDKVFLTSSLTAKAFYERNGYARTGEATAMRGLPPGFPMSKTLAEPR